MKRWGTKITWVCFWFHSDIFGKRGANCDGDCPMCQKVKSSNASVIEVDGKFGIRTIGLSKILLLWPLQRDQNKIHFTSGKRP